VRLIVLAALMLAMVGIGSVAGAADGVGVTTMTIDVPDQDRALDVTLWHPAKAGGTPARLGGSAVFEGVDAYRDAPIADGLLPLVLIAHGGLRSAPGHGNWIGSGLAARGFAAAVVRGPTLGPRDAAIAVDEIWRRPADLGVALSALRADPEWSGHLDPVRTGAVGFFLGGTSVLALVGARLDPDRFAASCDDGTGVDCAWFAAAGVDLRSVDAEPLTRSYRDRRIKGVVAIDPELTTSLAPDSLAAITVPVAIVDLGPTDAADLAAAVPGARHTAVAGATAFDTFSLCTPQGPALLRADGESDVICEDGEQGRALIHAQLTELIADALAGPLGLAP